nr:hypothetical protein CFP56_47295 [Quercus suber]
MLLLAWNCRGIGRDSKVRALKELIRALNLDLVFLSETKIQSPRINRIKTCLNFFDYFYVEANGRAGGLALFWRMGVDLEIVYSDSNVIASLIYSDPDRSPWMLFCVYGPPRRAKRKKIWAKVEELAKSFSGPWAVMGDFNSIKGSKEKKGGRHVGESSVNSLRDFINNTGAIDLDFIGPSFTWSNRCEGLANIRQRLDQCLGDQEWQTLFPKESIRHLVNACSDHNPILLDTHMENTNLDKHFRFEAMWTRDESSKEVVKSAWQTRVDGPQSLKLAKKLDATRRDLKRWNKSCFGSSRERIKELEQKIAQIQSLGATKENLELEASLSLELDEWLQALTLDHHLGPHFKIPAGTMHDILYISLRSHLSHSHRPDPLSYLAEAVSLVSKASPTIALSHMFNALGIVAAALVESSGLQ